jgi:hypothetical protein
MVFARCGVCGPPYLGAQVRVHAHVLHHALRLPARAVGVVVERGLDRAGVRIKMLVGLVPGARWITGYGVWGGGSKRCKVR